MTNFSKRRESIPDGISVCDDLSTLEFESDYGISNENSKRPLIECDKAKNEKRGKLEAQSKTTNIFGLAGSLCWRRGLIN